MPKSNNENDKPQFDTSKLTYRWGRRFTALSADIAAKAVLVETPAKEGLSVEDKARLNLGKYEALKSVNDDIGQRDEMLAEITTYVPRSWLAEDAPTKLEGVEILDWIFMERIIDLVSAFNQRNEQEVEDSKN